jgi:hypothetical protein
MTGRGVGGVLSAIVEAIDAEDPERRRRWVGVVASSPSVVNGVLGGIVLKSHRRFAEFLEVRLGRPTGDVIPAMLAGAVGGVVQAATADWLVHGGDLAAAVREGLGMLERGIGSAGGAH